MNLLKSKVKIILNYAQIPILSIQKLKLVKRNTKLVFIKIFKFVFFSKTCAGLNFGNFKYHGKERVGYKQ